jgi:hypothetical protein
MTNLDLNYSTILISYRAVNTSRLGYKTIQVKLYREEIAAFSEYTKKILFIYKK